MRVATGGSSFSSSKAENHTIWQNDCIQITRKFFSRLIYSFIVLYFHPPSFQLYYEFCPHFHLSFPSWEQWKLLGLTLDKFINSTDWVALPSPLAFLSNSPVAGETVIFKVSPQTLPLLVFCPAHRSFCLMGIWWLGYILQWCSLHALNTFKF